MRIKNKKEPPVKNYCFWDVRVTSVPVVRFNHGL